MRRCVLILFLHRRPLDLADARPDDNPARPSRERAADPEGRPEGLPREGRGRILEGRRPSSGDDGLHDGGHAGKAGLHRLHIRSPGQGHGPRRPAYLHQELRREVQWVTMPSTEPVHPVHPDPMTPASALSVAGTERPPWSTWFHPPTSAPEVAATHPQGLGWVGSSSFHSAEIMQTVWKVGLSGFRRCRKAVYHRAWRTSRGLTARSCCFCRKRWTTMSERTIRSGSSRPSSTGWILRQRVRPCRAEGDGTSRLRSGRSAEAVHLWLPEPGPVEPAPGG